MYMDDITHVAPLAIIYWIHLPMKNWDQPLNILLFKRKSIAVPGCGLNSGSTKNSPGQNNFLIF